MLRPGVIQQITILKVNYFLSSLHKHTSQHTLEFNISTNMLYFLVIALFTFRRGTFISSLWGGAEDSPQMVVSNFLRNKSLSYNTLDLHTTKRKKNSVSIKLLLGNIQHVSPTGQKMATLSKKILDMFLY